MRRFQGLEDRVAAFAATQELALEDLRQLVELVRLEQRQAEAEIALYGEQATSCANEALARADAALRRLEVLAGSPESREGAEGGESPDVQPAAHATSGGGSGTIEQQITLIVQMITMDGDRSGLFDDVALVSEQRERRDNRNQ